MKCYINLTPAHGGYGKHEEVAMSIANPRASPDPGQGTGIQTLFWVLDIS